jgi:hypothetical protein
VSASIVQKILYDEVVTRSKQIWEDKQISIEENAEADSAQAPKDSVNNAVLQNPVFSIPQQSQAVSHYVIAYSCTEPPPPLQPEVMSALSIIYG